jgi:hypothetical protein
MAVAVGASRMTWMSSSSRSVAAPSCHRSHALRARSVEALSPRHGPGRQHVATLAAQPVQVDRRLLDVQANAEHADGPPGADEDEHGRGDGHDAAGRHRQQEQPDDRDARARQQRDGRQREQARERTGQPHAGDGGHAIGHRVRPSR